MSIARTIAEYISIVLLAGYGVLWGVETAIGIWVRHAVKRPVRA